MQMGEKLSSWQTKMSIHILNSSKEANIFMSLHVLTPQNPFKKYKFRLEWDGGWTTRMNS